MGIDYRTVIMYGKEFESYTDAADELLRLGKITEECYDSIVEDGDTDEFSAVGGISGWECYSAYSGGYGVLGLEFTAKELYETDHTQIKAQTAIVDSILGEGCEIHEFVCVY